MSAIGDASLPDRARYAEQGWIGPIDALDAATTARLRAAVDDVILRLDELRGALYEVEAAYLDRPGEVVCHFLGGWRVHPELRALIANPAITRPAAHLLGVRRLRLWHDQVFAKPPHHPGVVPWHQDYSYWTRLAPAQLITVHVSLDDADVDNGCLHYVSGSQNCGLLPKIPFDAPLETIRASAPIEVAWRPTAVAVRAGQATLHGPHTLHGSPANRSSRPRRAIVLNYMGPDVRVADAAAPLLAGVPLLPVGAVVDGPHFPIVIDLDQAEHT